MLCVCVCVCVCFNREILKLVASVLFAVVGGAGGERAVDPDARFSPATAAV